MPDSLNELTADQPTLAQVFGVSVRTIQRWDGAGLEQARVGDEATYRVQDAVAWRVARERADAEEESASAGLQEARRRKAEADATMKELELARQLRQVVPVDEVVDLVRTPLEEVDARLRSAPSRLSGEWAPRLKVTRRQAVDLLRGVSGDCRAILREVFEEMGGEEGADAA